jgi:hypothetical protein
VRAALGGINFLSISTCYVYELIRPWWPKKASGKEVRALGLRSWARGPGKGRSPVLPDACVCQHVCVSVLGGGGTVWAGFGQSPLCKTVVGQKTDAGEYPNFPSCLHFCCHALDCALSLVSWPQKFSGILVATRAVTSQFLPVFATGFSLEST